MHRMAYYLHLCNVRSLIDPDHLRKTIEFIRQHVDEEHWSKAETTFHDFQDRVGSFEASNIA